MFIRKIIVVVGSCEILDSAITWASFFNKVNFMVDLSCLFFCAVCKGSG